MNPKYFRGRLSNTLEDVAYFVCCAICFFCKLYHGVASYAMKIDILCCSFPELERCAVQMAEMYCKNLPLSKDLDPQESMHGEELLSLICNVLVQVCLYVDDRSFYFIVECCKCYWIVINVLY